MSTSTYSRSSSILFYRILSINTFIIIVWWAYSSRKNKLHGVKVRGIDTGRRQFFLHAELSWVVWRKKMNRNFSRRIDFTHSARARAENQVYTHVLRKRVYTHMSRKRVYSRKKDEFESIRGKDKRKS